MLTESWTIKKVQTLSEIYKETAKLEPDRKKEFEEKATALNVLVAILKQIPEKRMSWMELKELLAQAREEVIPQKRWLFFSTKRKPIPLSLFTEKIRLYRQFKEQLEAHAIAAK